MTVSSFMTPEPPSIQPKDGRTSFLKTLARHKMKACLHSKKQTRNLSAKHTQTPGLQKDSLLGCGAYQVCQQSHKKTLTSPAIENSRVYTNGHLNYGGKRWVTDCHLDHLRSPGDAVWGLAGVAWLLEMCLPSARQWDFSLECYELHPTVRAWLQLQSILVSALEGVWLSTTTSVGALGLSKRHGIFPCSIATEEQLEASFSPHLPHREYKDQEFP